ncbi:MAG: YggS family pyridoxal phosphate-dependent enzyme [Methylocystaceae bacterium]
MYNPANLKMIRSKIADAARSNGRKPEDITLIAVSKTVDAAIVKAAWDDGQVDFGENRVQDFIRKQAVLPEARWHFIGRLQTNKAKEVARLAWLVHSLDRDELAVELNKRAAQAGRVLPVLIEVNISGETSKTGFSVNELTKWLPRADQFKNLRILGLMTMAPWSDSPENSRPYFHQAKELYDNIQKEDYPYLEMKYLSMGMSDDYLVALEEGANMVRIGTAIFGPRIIG